MYEVRRDAPAVPVVQCTWRIPLRRERHIVPNHIRVLHHYIRAARIFASREEQCIAACLFVL